MKDFEIVSVSPKRISAQKTNKTIEQRRLAMSSLEASLLDISEEVIAAGINGMIVMDFIKEHVVYVEK